MTVLQKKTGINRLLFAFKHSKNGLMSALQYEAAFRQELVCFIMLTVLSFWLPITSVEQILMLASLILVLIVELLNSAIESLADRISMQWHPLIERAKDYGSLAVLLALLIAVAIWLVILLSKFTF